MSDFSADVRFIKLGAITSLSLVALIGVTALKRMRDRGQIKTLNLAPKASKTKESRPAVNALFAKQFARLIKILIPSVWSIEMGYTALVGGLLVLRTFCDIWMISNATRIERFVNSSALLCKLIAP
jgi:hypothetical protein